MGNLEQVIFNIYKFAFTNSFFQPNMFNSSDNIIKNIIESSIQNIRKHNLNNDKIAIIGKLKSDNDGFLGIYSITAKPDSFASNARSVLSYEIIEKQNANSTYDFSTFFYIDYNTGYLVIKNQRGVEGIRTVINSLLKKENLVLDIKFADNWKENYSNFIQDISSIEIRNKIYKDPNYIDKFTSLGNDVNSYLTVDYVKFKVGKSKPKDFIKRVLETEIKDFETFRIFGADSVTKNSQCFDLIKNNVSLKVNKELHENTFNIGNVDEVHTILKNIASNII